MKTQGEIRSRPYARNITGEAIIFFTLAESPLFRQAKRYSLALLTPDSIIMKSLA